MPSRCLWPSWIKFKVMTAYILIYIYIDHILAIGDSDWFSIFLYSVRPCESTVGTGRSGSLGRFFSDQHGPWLKSAGARADSARRAAKVLAPRNAYSIVAFSWWMWHSGSTFTSLKTLNTGWASIGNPRRTTWAIFDAFYDSKKLYEAKFSSFVLLAIL